MDAGTLDPRKTALLVVDKQAGYFDPALVRARDQDLPVDHAEILEQIDNFIAACRLRGLPVIWTKMIEDKKLSPPQISALMKDPGLSITRPGQPSFEIYGRVTPRSNETVITKNYYNAFAHTDLSSRLRDLGITTIILVGGYASRCVLATIVGANGEDFLCVLPRGLVINQQNAAGEIPALYDAVNAIYGFVIEPPQILSALDDK